MIFALLLLGGYMLPFMRTAQMILAAGETAAEKMVAEKLKTLCKYSRWQFSGITEEPVTADCPAHLLGHLGFINRDAVNRRDASA